MILVDPFKTLSDSEKNLRDFGTKISLGGCYDFEIMENFKNKLRFAFRGRDFPLEGYYNTGSRLVRKLR